ncbi:MAG: VWA domain-containing protein [Thermosynechococcaceae cyanobacterium]
MFIIFVLISDLVFISDLYEGGDNRSMLKRMGSLVQSGVQCVALLALNDEGAPCFDHENAAKLATLGIPSFACSPDQFPGLMAVAIARQDLSQWAAKEEIVTAAQLQ